MRSGSGGDILELRRAHPLHLRGRVGKEAAALTGEPLTTGITTADEDLARGRHLRSKRLYIHSRARNTVVVRPRFRVEILPAQGNPPTRELGTHCDISQPS